MFVNIEVNEHARRLVKNAVIQNAEKHERFCIVQGKYNLRLAFSSSNALRSLSTRTDLMPFVSSPRCESSVRNSTTFNFSGSIARDIFGIFLTHALLFDRKSRRKPIHAPVTRVKYTIWRYNCKQRVTCSVNGFYWSMWHLLELTPTSLHMKLSSICIGAP